MLRKAGMWVGVVGAGLITLAGCANMPLLSWLGGDVKVPTAVSFAALAANGQFTYAVSVQETSVSLQDLLKRVGLPVLNVSEDPGTGIVRIKTFAPNNEEFTVVLYPENSGSKTRVAIEWEKASAGKNGLKILLELEKIKRPAGGGA